MKKNILDIFSIKIFILFIVFSILMSCSSDEIFKLETSSFSISIDSQGRFTNLIDKSTNKDYIFKDSLSYLISLKFNNKFDYPNKVYFDKNTETIDLQFDKGIEAKVKYYTNSDYLKFKLTSINKNDSIELITWGKYFTKLNKIIGETVGVVQGDDFAIGLQALNPKTLGGFPWTNNDCMPQINIFSQDDYSDLSEKGKDYVLYRVEAAKPIKDGSSLQAYCRNRNNERIISNLEHEYYISPKYEDGGIIGSSIALFGCKKENILPTIEKIEINENLPHPMLEGKWAKNSQFASRAYLIYDFSENNIEKAIQLTEKAGLKYLYNSNPFETWGHFKLSSKLFPNGIKGLKDCVHKANQHGINIGVHTLSNFITTNDKYVTPIPDKRLGKVGSSIITKRLNKYEKIISIQDPKFFNQFDNNNLKTVIIDSELIRYGNVIEKDGWKLIDCERGAFGTKSSVHKPGTVLSLLADHGYKVFLTTPELSLEISENIATLFNETGLRQISFDGLEGNRSTGMGNYGEILFAFNWYNHLNDNIKKSFIADASRTSHFFWHIYTRMNWGEPWYAGFRESQTEYRLKNQEYFKRNLMPGMLGWFQLKPETSVEDIDWMLARSAGFDAGYAFVVTDKSISKNKLSDEIFEQIGLWEKLRLSNSFSDDQKLLMRDIKNEFKIEQKKDDLFELTQIHSENYIHKNKNLQPGQPHFSEFSFDNPFLSSKAEIIIIAKVNNLKNIVIEFDNYKNFNIPNLLNKDEILKISEDGTVRIYKSNWEKLSEFKLDNYNIEFNRGRHKLNFDCNYSGVDNNISKIEVRLSDKPIFIKLKTI